ncbi:outer membrane beta-barrel protein [Flavobacterium sp.]|uniref:outer membrane beta-barrel protein n=1 Tax=Flavobacterium sp. TaxID=239 RepID=UPI00286E1898|nr:outer membrane beta-barrel protein [Flavobacterium sp.]
MNHQIKIIIPFLFLCFGISNAQINTKITGQIGNGNSLNIASIPISLVQSNDGTLVKTALTNADGSFEFLNLNANTYKIIVDNDQFQLFKSQPIEITTENTIVTLPVFQLLANDNVNNLDEVVVKKRKPFIEQKIDRTVVNVDAFISTAGGDAMDVLEKSPGITVDQNGTITFKGKSGVVVFVDDKPTYLSGADLESYLKSLPSSTLDKIELMTNPPAKYDAAGGAGVINIITKKSKAKGFNGSATSRVSQGKRTHTRQGLNLNYLNNDIRIFGNIGYAYQNPINDLYIFRGFKNEDLSAKSLFKQNSFIESNIKTTNAKIGMDYYVSDKTTFGIGLTGILKSNNQSTNVSSVLTSASGVLNSTIKADNSEKESFKNAGVNMNFRHNLDTIGQKITVDLDYLRYDTKTNQKFRNFIYSPDGSLQNQDELKGILPAEIAIYAIKSDYTLPLKNEGSLEAGFKSSFSKTDNTADYRDVVSGNEIPNYETSNQFKYDEIINAAYLNYNTSYKRFTFQTGLRLENAVSKGNQLGNVLKPASTFKRDYTNLFPTVYVQYKLDSIGNNQLVVNYGKRINRPYFQDLNPFISPLDKFTFYSGNPFLNPSFANNYELSYRYKGIFSTTVSYGSNTDEINETIEIKDEIYYSRPGNIGKSQFYSININADIPFNKWWSANIYSELTNTRFQSKLYTEDLNSSGTFWYFSMNNSFKFKNDWSAELSGIYQTDAVAAQFILLSRSNINFGIQKKVLKGKASVKLSVNDILYTNINNGIIKNLKLTDANWSNKPDSRFVALTITYGFGKSFQPKSQHEAIGADSEKNRVKG